MEFTDLSVIPPGAKSVRPKPPTPEQCADKAQEALRALEKSADQVASIRSAIASYARELDTVGEAIEGDLRARASAFHGLVERFAELANETAAAFRAEREKLDVLQQRAIDGGRR